MQADFWHERWRTRKIGFHQDTVAPALQEYWPTLNLPDGSRTFVPLCGKSLDMLWLQACGHEVLGVELSSLAVESFCMENGVQTRRSSFAQFEQYRAVGLTLLCGDFFGLTPSLLGPCRAVYDRAALVSWPPHLQARYIKQLIALTPRGCETLLITCEYPQDQMAGPPFSVDLACVNRLYSDSHAVRHIDSKDLLAVEPKWRARGVTQLIESVYHLTRL